MHPQSSTYETNSKTKFATKKITYFCNSCLWKWNPTHFRQQVLARKVNICFALGWPTHCTLDFLFTWNVQSRSTIFEKTHPNSQKLCCKTFCLCAILHTPYTTFTSIMKTKNICKIVNEMCGIEKYCFFLHLLVAALELQHPLALSVRKMVTWALLWDSLRVFT